MKNSKILLASLILFSLSALSAHAAESCKATRWPYARNQSKRDIVKTLKMIRDRDVIEQYLFKELSEPESGPLAYYLHSYLTFTEENEDMLGFYELLGWGAELKDEASTPRKLSLKEICDYYEKAKKLTRDPASPKKASKKGKSK